MPLIETTGSLSARSFGLNSVRRSDLILYLDAGNSASYPGSGTTWNDLSVYSRPLTFFRTPSYSSADGGYINFPGDIAGSRNFAENGPFAGYNVDNLTVEVWTRINTSTTQSGFWIEKGVVNTQYAAFMEGSALRWRLNGSDTFTSPEIQTSSYLNTNTWYQLVFTHTPGQQQFYRNSSLQFTRSAGTNLNKFDQHGFTVGAWRNEAFSNSPTETNHGYYIDARMSIIRVYNRVLNQSEITANFNQFRSRYGI